MPFRVNVGPIHAYVAIPGGKTCYLSELKVGKEVLVVDQNGIQRTTVVGRVKIETRPLIIVDAKHHCRDMESIRKQNYHSMVISISERVGEDSGNTEAFGAIADCYTELGDLERAATFYDQYISRLQAN